jgi:hypothetical protein
VGEELMLKPLAEDAAIHPPIAYVEMRSALQKITTISLEVAFQTESSDTASAADETFFLLTALHVGLDGACQQAACLGWKCAALIERLRPLLESFSVHVGGLPKEDRDQVEALIAMQVERYRPDSNSGGQA